MKEELVLIQLFWQRELASAKEGLWAKPLGNNLYELRNTPRIFPNLNSGDIVRAEMTKESENLLFQEAISYGGHQTVRFVFSRGTFDYETLEVLTGLREQGFLPEQATDRMYVTDVVSSEEYQRVRQYLEPWQWSGRVKIAEVSSMEEMLEILAS